MLISARPDAFASTVPPVGNSSFPSNNSPEIVTHTLRGSLPAVRSTIRTLFKLNYADPNDWSKPVPTGNPNEVMVVLTRRVRL